SRKAIQIDARSALAHGCLGKARRAQGDLAGAVASFRRAADLAQGPFAEAHWRGELGNVLRAHGDLEGAIAAYRKAGNHDERAGLDLHRPLAEALRAKGTLVDAVALERRALGVLGRLEETSSDARYIEHLKKTLASRQGGDALDFYCLAQ